MLPAQLVIFDMDGLMFDTERIAVDAWHYAGAQFGVEIPAALVIETVGLNRQSTEALLRNRLGDDFPYHEVRLKRLQYAEEIIAGRGVPVKDGLYALLDYLDCAGIPKAVATSTERARAQRLMELAGVANRFDAILCGDEVARSKPFPDIFLAAAARLGCEPPACMVLEDSESGLRAAHAAGMLPVLVPDLKMPSEEVQALTFQTFPSLWEVARFLEESSAQP